MTRVILSLGSNLGDRRKNLDGALELLKEELGPITSVTEYLNTASCGFSGPDFLNCIAVFQTRRRPHTVLKICKDIERRMGRTDTPEYDNEGRRIYRDRIIDIDILFYGDRHIDTPDLTIPHPQVYSRPYIRELLETLFAGTPDVTP